MTEAVPGLSHKNGCEGPPPKPPPIFVATAGWALLADSPRRPLRRPAAKQCRLRKPRLRRTAALQAATDLRCHGGMPLLGDSLEGGRSVGAATKQCRLRKPRLRGTAALQANSGHENFDPD
jgi:hypothetical protein